MNYFLILCHLSIYLIISIKYLLDLCCQFELLISKMILIYDDAKKERWSCK